MVIPMRELYQYTERLSSDVQIKLQVSRSDVYQMVASDKNTPEENNAAIDAYLNARAAIRVYDATLNEYQASVASEPSLSLPDIAGALQAQAQHVADQLRASSYNRSVVLRDLGDVVWFVAKIASALEVELSELVEVHASKH